ncbi:hypothetical protein [Gloeobacter morelensis]|uniref:Leucine-rich repeat domain-containing protein n=1 Tax=Gloeobacter morelensis MG652769 TaxID=2781736 RepID=A0ABY3PG32_9CYAN|nr:hypothetical protein [Gloeobacter morelensis]UFP92600.1 hypothetical protein ISF26_12165 [Gloeobacter morelensis MG652769]
MNIPRMARKLPMWAAALAVAAWGAASLAVRAAGPPAVDPGKVLLEDVPEALQTLSLQYLPGSEKLQLGQIAGAGGVSVRDFPGLSKVLLKDVPSLKSSCPVAAACRNLTLSQAVAQGYLPAGFLDSPIGSLAGLGSLALEKIPDITDIPLADIPGLGLNTVESLGLSSCFLGQLVDHVNFDFNGFTEFSLPAAQRFKVGQSVVCNGKQKIKHTRVDEVEGKGYFELYVRTPCGPGCTYWAGPFPWPPAVETLVWIGPQGKVSTRD